MLLVRHELAPQRLECGNLKEAIEQVESEKSFAVTRLQIELTQKVVYLE